MTDFVHRFLLLKSYTSVWSGSACVCDRSSAICPAARWMAMYSLGWPYWRSKSRRQNRQMVWVFSLPLKTWVSMFCIQNKIIFVSSLVMFCVISYDIYIYIIYVPPPPQPLPSATADPINCTNSSFPPSVSAAPKPEISSGAPRECWRKTMGKTPLQSLTLHPWKIMGQEDDLASDLGEWQVFFLGELFHFGRVCSTLEVKVKLFPTPRHKVDPTIQSIHQLGSSIKWISLTNQHQSRQMH